MNPVLDHSMIVPDRPRETLDSPHDDGGDDTIDVMAQLYHRMNNTLVPILAYASLGERASQDEKVQGYCAKIHQSACNLRALIELASARQVQR